MPFLRLSASHGHGLRTSRTRGKLSAFSLVSNLFVLFSLISAEAVNSCPADVVMNSEQLVNQLLDDLVSNVDCSRVSEIVSDSHPMTGSSKDSETADTLSCDTSDKQTDPVTMAAADTSSPPPIGAGGGNNGHPDFSFSESFDLDEKLGDSNSKDLVTDSLKQDSRVSVEQEQQLQIVPTCETIASVDSNKSIDCCQTLPSVQTYNPTVIPPITGFMTAGGRNVVVSKSSADAARQLLDDPELPDEGANIKLPLFEVEQAGDKVGQHARADMQTCSQTPSSVHHTGPPRLVESQPDCDMLDDSLSEDAFYSPPAKKFNVVRACESMSNLTAEPDTGLSSSRLVSSVRTSASAPDIAGFQAISKRENLPEPCRRAIECLFEDNADSVYHNKVETTPQESGAANKGYDNKLNIDAAVTDDTRADGLDQLPQAPNRWIQSYSHTQNRLVGTRGVEVLCEPAVDCQRTSTVCAVDKPKSHIDSEIVIDTLNPSQLATPVAPAAGFTTASGKSMGVDQRSLEKVRDFFASESETEKPPAAGFTTASGRNLSVSHTSLDAVKNLLENDMLNTSSAGKISQVSIIRKSSHVTWPNSIDHLLNLQYRLAKLSEYRLGPTSRVFI